MKPAKFDYHSAPTLAQACMLLRQADTNVKPLGGGQSLGPMLNLRLVRPQAVVSLSGLAELRVMQAEGDAFRIGGGLTHAEIEDGVLDGLLAASPALAAMLKHAAGTIAYRAVRNRGTLAGSLAHADPAADWILVMRALDAVVLATDGASERRIPMADYMQGAFTTALREGEILGAVLVPRYSPGMRWGYAKFCRKPGDFAEASCAAVFDAAKGVASITLGAMDGAPQSLPALAARVAREGAQALSRATVDEALAPLSTLDRSRRQLVATVLQRSVTMALEGKPA
ncbi:MAG: carbon monoxide dehydrogenase [Paucimonas sp.]|nr:carbon monoxide dehydrogenase [Paucimonas sp.]